MINQHSFFSKSIVVALLVSIAFAVSSCGSQKMGCPGSITQSEQPAPSHS